MANNTLMTTHLSIEKLKIQIAPTREETGKNAAGYVASLMKKLLKEKKQLRMVFAAAPSQNEFLHYLSSDKEIEWSSVTAFHMDEYIGLAAESPQLFSNYLREHLFSRVLFSKTYFMQSMSTDVAAECRRYELLLKEQPIDIVCLGIGENGHLAFNDPPVADFKDPASVKVVELDALCRQQQVNDGCFELLDHVPTHAVTMTIPALLSASHLSIVVPGLRKADAVFQTLYGEISTGCPASILRTCSNAVLHLDSDSASRLEEMKGRS